MVDVRIPADADVIVLQRVTHRLVADAVSLIRAKGVAVVIDMDDDLRTIHPANPAFAAIHPRRGTSIHSWHNAQRACEAATLVTVSTNELVRRYAPHGRGVVLDNHVPARYLDVTHHDSDLLGWGGSIHSHPDDLQAAGTALTRLCRAGARFRVIGPRDGVREALRLDAEPEWTGVLDLTTQWPTALTSLGVGLAPLADTVFNGAKSWLKPLEYAALGVPCVVSPRVEYVRLHKRGVGLLARNPHEWYRQLGRLRGDPTLRAELSESGREAARGLLTEDHSWRWAEAWADAFRLQRRGVTPLVRSS